MPRASIDRKQSGIVIRVVGTSPLSFDVPTGTILQVKEFGPSAYSRPSVAGGFKRSAYLLFANQTKVGRLSPASLKKLPPSVPATCTVVEVDKSRKRLSVIFQ